MTMSTNEISLEVQRIEEARLRLGERSDVEIVGALARVFDLWREPASSSRRELEAKLPAATGFDPATVRAGLELGFAPWTGEAFEKLVESELGALRANPDSNITGHSRTSVLLAGSIPMPSLLSIISPLVLRSSVLCKPASRDIATPTLIVDSIRRVDPMLADCVAITPFDWHDEAASLAFYASPCVAATGDNQTLRDIQKYIGPHQRVLKYRHRISIAVVDLQSTEQNRSKLLEQLAIDIALWDQLGCLSPISIYLVGGGAQTMRSFASGLGDALAEIETRWPRGAITAEAAAQIAQERSGAEMRSSLGRDVALFASKGSQWTVALEDTCELRPAPLHRFIRLMPIASPQEISVALAPLGPNLAGVAIAGFGENQSEITNELFALGASRVCAPGQLQTPALSWQRDNLPVLRALAQLGNHEIEHT